MEHSEDVRNPPSPVLKVSLSGCNVSPASTGAMHSQSFENIVSALYELLNICWAIISYHIFKDGTPARIESNRKSDSTYSALQTMIQSLQIFTLTLLKTSGDSGLIEAVLPVLCQTSALSWLWIKFHGLSTALIEYHFHEMKFWTDHCSLAWLNYSRF